MLVVMKFGGSSVADLDKIRNVAERCIRKWKEGNRVVVVLSAMGKTTDRLLAQAGEISKMPSRREMDMLLATGEQVSVSLMAMTMIQMGVTAISLNAWQVPMHTNSTYQNAKLKRIDCERIRKELDSRELPEKDVHAYFCIDDFRGYNGFGLPAGKCFSRIAHAFSRSVGL